jgi:hypothetical protein
MVAWRTSRQPPRAAVAGAAKATVSSRRAYWTRPWSQTRRRRQAQQLPSRSPCVQARPLDCPRRGAACRKPRRWMTCRPCPSRVSERSARRRGVVAVHVLRRVCGPIPFHSIPSNPFHPIQSMSSHPFYCFTYLQRLPRRRHVGRAAVVPRAAAEPHHVARALRAPTERVRAPGFPRVLPFRAAHVLHRSSSPCLPSPY